MQINAILNILNIKKEIRKKTVIIRARFVRN